jgi:hypothetical protein
MADRGVCGRPASAPTGPAPRREQAAKGGWKGDQAPIAGFTPFCDARSPSGLSRPADTAGGHHGRKRGMPEHRRTSAVPKLIVNCYPPGVIPQDRIDVTH